MRLTGLSRNIPTKSQCMQYILHTHTLRSPGSILSELILVTRHDIASQVKIASIEIIHDVDISYAILLKKEGCVPVHSGALVCQQNLNECTCECVCVCVCSIPANTAIYQSASAIVFVLSVPLLKERVTLTKVGDSCSSCSYSSPTPCDE